LVLEIVRAGFDSWNRASGLVDRWIGALDFRFVGGGESVLEGFLTMSTPISVLGAVFAVRVFATIASCSTGAPGGPFAPMLALGTIGGVAYGELIVALDLGAGLIPAHFAVAGMGAFFAAVVRAPLTGIILTAEMTGVGLPVASEPHLPMGSSASWTWNERRLDKGQI
jgi:H+/Cl- antiporter ClcA